MAEDKKQPTYVSMRMKDSVMTQDGEQVAEKRHVNLFDNGGRDKNGNPILNNPDSVAFVQGRNLAIFPLEKADPANPEKRREIKKGPNGQSVDPLKRNLEAFLTGHTQGLDARSLKEGEATIIGPGAERLSALFKSSIAEYEAKQAAKAEARAADPSSTPSP